ncbi:hypothetical protein OUZ56_032795 [Daphnia magna]|uniref:Uncharacterized protein n=1 Tax=Daphnia magna TaxID=35525 RepID=A0ABQ9ZY39_9CRUS|nr:hypothetical protein OUZ56_032795 [Daphnia magna]
MDGSNRDSSAAVISLEEVTAIEDERDELSVVEIPVIEESPGNVLSPANFTASPILDLGREFASSFNTQNFSWLYELPPQENTSPTILSQEIFDPSPYPETLTFVPSQQSNQTTSLNVAQLTGSLKHIFYKTLALKKPEKTLTKEKETKTGRCRTLGHRSSKRHVRKIQRLFNIFPRRAVREVLEDLSPSYDGTVEAVEEYLERTYHHSSPPPQQCHNARELYDTCD